MDAIAYKWNNLVAVDALFEALVFLVMITYVSTNRGWETWSTTYQEMSFRGSNLECLGYIGSEVSKMKIQYF